MKPVAIAIVLTVVVCGLCMAAYLKFVVEPKFRALSNRVATSSIHADCVEAASGEYVASSPQQSGKHWQEAWRTAALIRGIRETKDAMRDEIEDGRNGDGNVNEYVRPSEEEIRANRLKQMATLEQDLEKEPVDSVWATEIEKVTEEAVAELNGNLELEEVTCRKTFCRARLIHSNPATRSNDIERLQLNPEFSTQSTIYIPPDNENATVMFFSREGHTLSVFSPPFPRISPPRGMEGDIELPPDLREESLQ